MHWTCLLVLLPGKMEAYIRYTFQPAKRELLDGKLAFDVSHGFHMNYLWFYKVAFLYK